MGLGKKPTPPKPNASEVFDELIEERPTKTLGIKIESKTITISLEEGFDVPTLKKVLQLLQKEKRISEELNLILGKPMEFEGT